MLCTCQTGFEALLARELSGAGAAPSAQGPSWVLAAPLPSGRPELALAHRFLLQPTEITGDSVNALAQRILEFFASQLRGERIEGPWPSSWQYPAEVPGLGRRASAVEAAFGELLRKKLARVAKLASDTLPRGGGPARGLFVWFADFGRVWVAREVWLNGQRRMADDALAPSRSYLKVEEAYGLCGEEPAPGESVADLGAAPGGWSYSAAKRGCRVEAVDNGPLKGGALNHPQITHRREDAFAFAPPAGTSFDWLFCDLLEEPHHVLRQIVTPWLTHGWCRKFIINFKFGRVDPLELKGLLLAPDSPLARASNLRIRHLFHNRDEWTAVGRLPPA